MMTQSLLFMLIQLTSAPPGPPQQPHHESTYLKLSQTPTQRPFARIAFFRDDSAWIADRALQALRQTYVSLHAGTWARPQVLPISEPSWLGSAGNGLCSARVQGTSGTLSFQLQITPRDFRRSLQHQSRAIGQAGRSLSPQCLFLFAHQRSPCSAF